MSCLDEETVVAFACGRLSGDGLEAVDAHLDACEECLLVVSALLDEVGPTESAHPRPPLLPMLRRGANVGRYVILDSLGFGASSFVFLAFDPQLERKVALKLIRGRSDDTSTTTQDALREARCLASLADPHVVTVYDAGHAGGHFYVAMELAEGGTLRQWLAQAQRSRREVLELFVKAGRGLLAAHERGIVHRDFKPDNVLIGRDGTVRVSDFGLAMLTRVDASAPVAVGTRRYVAPEQLAGRRVDPRADQYSFGVSLREALGAARAPAWLHALLERATRSDPEERFASMRELLRRLETGLSSSRLRRRLALGAVGAMLIASLGAVAWRALESRERTCRGGDQLWAGTITPLALASIRDSFSRTQLPYAARSAQRLADALAAFGREWQSQRLEACRATHVRGEQSERMLAARLACLDDRLERVRLLVEGLSRADAGVVARAAGMSSSLPSLSPCADTRHLSTLEDPPSDTEARERIHALRGRLARVSTAYELGDYGGAVALAEALGGAVEAQGYAPLTAELLWLHGRARGELAQYEEAFRLFRRAALEAERGRDLRTQAMSYLALVDLVGSRMGRGELGELYLEHADASVARTGDRALHARLAEARALLAFARVDLMEAAAHQREAVSSMVAAHGPDDLRTAWARSFLGSILADAGHPTQALEEHRAALAIVERLLGDDHPELAKTLNNYANGLRLAGKLEESLSLHRRALGIRTRSLGATHALTASTMRAMAEVLVLLGRGEEAMRVILEALPLLKAAYGKSHHRTFAAVFTQGEALLSLGRLREARRVVTRARGLLGDAPAEVAVATLSSLEGALALEEGDAERAIGSLTSAIEVFQRHRLHDDLALAKLRLGLALSRARGRDAAYSLMREAATLLAAAGPLRRRELEAANRWLADDSSATRRGATP